MMLRGKTALVTGGSRGIGRAIVERLAGEGATVVFGYRQDKAAADDLVRRLQGDAFGADADTGVGVVAVQADLADLSSVEALFERVADLAGGLDTLVNNAATNPRRPFADITAEEFDHVMAVNARFPALAMRRAASVLREGGRIVNISTLNTVLPAPGHALYCASKAALEQLTAVAARELGMRGITVNTVSPGATDTDMLHATNAPEALEQTRALTALGRFGRPSDIASVVAFLAGPDSQWITGQNLRATGGLLV